MRTFRKSFLKSNLIRLPYKKHLICVRERQICKPYSNLLGKLFHVQPSEFPKVETATLAYFTRNISRTCSRIRFEVNLFNLFIIIHFSFSVYLSSDHFRSVVLEIIPSVLGKAVIMLRDVSYVSRT